MDVSAIREYQAAVERTIQHGGSRNETTIRSAFIRLVNKYAQAKGLELVEEIAYKTTAGNTVRPDGTLKDKLRQDWGYYESKDTADDLQAEVTKKFAKGYPSDNILFEDSQRAWLYRKGQLVEQAEVADHEALAHLLQNFVSYERPEVRTFREAITHFGEDVPRVTETLRALIADQEKPKKNPRYIAARDKFWELCKESINPLVSLDDVREMMIQHILTADIFNTVFDEPHFHRENNVAQELEGVVSTFFTGDVRRQALGRIQHYYQTINAAAAQIADHHEKQRFLKVLYETFYKSYNPKAADRLGVVYTPNEIVRFMVEGTDWLLEKHFGRKLEDKGVEILDPATGTGTYICEIIDYLGQTEASRKKLAYKYREELHANEVAILPYYIANLNIEFTYKQRMGEYAEFKNLCFVDTLDNIDFDFVGKQKDLFGGLSAENAERIRRQNQRKISVIIGNPPYNAKQANYNFQNANRGYGHIDRRIKETFIKQGTAQNQIVVYDMYTRFYRWAMDRLDSREGVIAFITNRSFIDGRAFDGFRKIIELDFQYAYIVDTHSDVRANPKISGTGYNVFGIQTGVAVMFLVRAHNGMTSKKPCRIEYIEMNDFVPKGEKVAWFAANMLKTASLKLLSPNSKGTWINQSDEHWEEYLPIASQDAKKKAGNAIFKLFSNGLKTQRDEWVYDDDYNNLIIKVKLILKAYAQGEDSEIKWDRELSKYKKSAIKISFGKDKIIQANYRPFIKQWLYYDRYLNAMPYQWSQLLSGDTQNQIVCINSPGNTKEFHCLSSNSITDLHFTGDSQCLPLYCYDKDGNRQDNITNWALEQFGDAYEAEGAVPDIPPHPQSLAAKKARLYAQLGKPIPEEEETATYVPKGQWLLTKETIFHYLYAVLHHPAYRTKYALNLKREFPRIPFYADFSQWAAWGKALMELHIGYEQVAPYALKQIEITSPDDHNADQNKLLAKAKLKAEKVGGTITLDGYTRLEGIPAPAWEYKLGNRSALEWVLDQYKEKTPKDPTIREKFNTYRFADYKAHVIDLLRRVCTVSVETQAIVSAMPPTVEEALLATAPA